MHDVALEREHRRSQLGYTTPADARAFLRMARQPPHQRPHAAPSTNPIAAAYFRAGDEALSSAEQDTRPHERVRLERSTAATVPESMGTIVDLLTEAGLMPERPRALLEGTDPQLLRFTQVRRLMASLGDTDDTAYFSRSRELAFLANTLMAGCSVQSRAFTAQEASDAAVGVCNLGLEHWPARWPHGEIAGVGTTLSDAFLLDHDLVMAFEVGWAVLHEDVSMFVAEHLSVTLTDLRCVDAEIQDGLHALRRELVKQRDAGTPWRARDALNVLSMLDMTAWVGVVGLLDECPVLPVAVTAILEKRKGAISPVAFEFISTTGQIREVRAFMEGLPDILLG